MSVVPSITLSVEAARRFHRRAVGLDVPHTDVGAALEHHGYVQIDPINVCGRMHDLILRNRVVDYAEGDLMRHVHGVRPGVERGAKTHAAETRTAFEHYLPARGILVAFESESWPYLRAKMRERETLEGAWSGKLDTAQQRMAERVLAEIAERGPLSSEDIDHEERSSNGWGNGTLAKTTLDKLFFHGRVLIARRNDARRVYDLPERLLPKRVLKMPEPTAEEIARWRVLISLRQHRLTTLKKNELPLVADLVQSVKIEGCPTLYILRDDLPLLEEAMRDANGDPVTRLPLLLAPLDPLIYNRTVTSKLWGLDYTWEVYTPPAKRVRGYYALPMLVGTEFVGHVDPKADRERKKLVVAARSLRRGYKAVDALKGLAKFLGLSSKL